MGRKWGRKWRKWTVALCLVVAAGGCVSPIVQPADTPPAKPSATHTVAASKSTLRSGSSLTLATYNVNYANAEDAATLDVIRGLPADVVFLQETNPSWEATLSTLRDAYPYLAWRHSGEAGGLAVLSRVPVAEKEVLPPPEGGWFPAWRVVVSSDLGEVQVLNVHLRPNIGDSGSFVSGLVKTPAIRQREMAHHIEHIDTTLPTIVLGDFNESPEGGAVRLLERKGFRSVLVTMGVTDHTWAWRTPVVPMREQVDHIMVDHHVDVVVAQVRHVGNSDHFPVLATLRAR